MKPFTSFTGLDILKIDIANAYGLDKDTFSNRIAWFDSQDNHLDLINDASEPLLYKKGVLAYHRAIKGNPIGYNAFMDATASGLQLMACLSNCKQTAEATNLIFNSKRNDPYTLVAIKMQEYLPNSPMFDGLTFGQVRSLLKKPIMTHYYNSKAKPKEIFGEDTEELNTFYKVLEELFPGAEAVLSIINDSWSSTSMYHEWTLPDGHVAHVKVIERVDTRIDVDELDMTFAYRFYPNQPSKKGTSLAPNIIHSIDAYVVREVIRRCQFEVAHIHDAFTCHPNNMPKLMDAYRNVLADIADSNLLQDILSQVEGKPTQLQKYDYDLSSDIRSSQYALS